MNAPQPHDMDSPAAAVITPLLRTVLICDIVESTALVERLGDVRAVALLQRHDQLMRQALELCHGRLIDKADGMLALFERPIQALDFALRYQRGLRELGAVEGLDLKARVGIHVGDVMTWPNSPQDVLAGAKPFEVEGLAKPVAARLMNLALPGQILMSGMAQNLCHRAAGELGAAGTQLRWLLHGRYNFKGVPAPMLVHEVGEPGLSPLRAPESGAKAWRELPVWRRPPMLALEMLVVVAIVLGLFWTTLRSPPAIAFAERDWVVVADLQNRTSEKVFDDSLDTALRVGLEQSRHINLVSELQIDRALERMQRQGQVVDRQLATELALREGAKAVILPTVAEVGGVVRVSLEVIDPNSGVTVYSESSDGRGISEALPAMDIAMGNVRSRLGEAMSSIESTSKPLEQVTTANLEALRAYSLAIRARFDSRFADAWELFQKAVELDPEFSMAYLRMAFIRYSANDGAGTEQYLALAEKYRSHLSDREAMFLDAARAIPESPDVAMGRLKSLAAMYPDEFRAYYNYAYFGHYAAQRYRESLDFLAPAAVVQNPARGSAIYHRGVLHLALGEHDEAIAAFQQAESLNVGGELRAYAEAFAADRNYEKSERLLRLQRSSGLASADFEQRLAEISFPIDQGRWQAALDAAAALQIDVAPNSQRGDAVLRGMRLAIRSYAPDPEFAQDLRTYFKAQAGALAAANRFDRRYIGFNVLAAGWMAAQSGDLATANDAIKLAGDLPETVSFPANGDMLAIVQAELALASKTPEVAVGLLEARVASGRESYFTHAVLMRAYAAQQANAKALSEAEWLIARRGLAYAEFNGLFMWQPVNLIESNLALDAAATFAGRLGQSTEEKSHRAAFAKAWPAHERLEAVARRARQY